MDPVRNPYAPGAGQRPPELAGRDGELEAFEVMLTRVGRGRPERSIVLTGLRGVGKTVLLNTLRSQAVRRGWGTGKVEARPEQSLRRPLAAALHLAVRELSAPAERDRARPRRAQVLRAAPQLLRHQGPRPLAAAASTCRSSSGRADSGDMEIDLVELLVDIGGLAGDCGRGVAVFLDEMQDLGAEDVSALCAAAHEISQAGLPFVVVGAGLPHLPAVLSASKSYSERLFRYARIDRLDREAADRALTAPAKEEDAEFTPDALDAMYDATAGYPYFVQEYGKTVWDVATRSPVTADDVRVAVPIAEAELAVGFFGSRYERATPAEREYLRAMADVLAQPRDAVEADGPARADGDEAVTDRRGRRPARPQAAVAVAGAGRAHQEGPGLQRRAGPHRVLGPALRPLPAPPGRLSRLWTDSGRRRAGRRRRPGGTA